MARDPEFLILKPTVGWLPESEWTEILGAAVKNPLAPTDDFSPENALFYNKTGLIEDAYDRFIVSNESLSSPSFEAEVKGLGKLRWQKSTGQLVDLRGKKIYIKRIKQHTRFWKEITTKDEDFLSEVRTWVRDKHWGRTKYQVCLVVGLLMCEDVVVVTSDKELKERQTRGEAPLGTVAEYVAASHGIPLATGGVGNISGDITTSTINRTYFRTQTPSTRVFALELRIITFKGDKLQLSDKTPDSNRKLGDNEDEDEDAMLRDIEPQEWEEMLQDE